MELQRVTKGEKEGLARSVAAQAAEAHPEIIRQLFITQYVEPCGIYRLRLYDVRKEKWVTLVVDDRIPMNDAGTAPRFTQPNGNELWVMLLEKAFAKMWSSYGRVSSACLVNPSPSSDHRSSSSPGISKATTDASRSRVSRGTTVSR